MTNIFAILMIPAMLAVVASLVLGVFAMAKGGETAGERSNKMMQARVVLQGVALLLLALAFLTRGGG